MERLNSSVQFGAQFRKQEYMMDPDVTFINHGSYGAVPNRILQKQQQYRDQMERNPDLWFRKQSFELHTQARQAMADFVKADLQDVVFALNATAGANTILKSYPFKKGDAILGTSLTYGAVRNTMNYMASRYEGVTAHYLDIKFPIQSEEEVVKLADSYLRQHPNIRIFVFDAITSPSAVQLPMRRLVEVCHDHGVLSLVDGAHAPGHLPLDMRALDPDFFTGNFHKWGFSPRGAAMLYVKRCHQSWVKPVITSWNFDCGLELEFFKAGTRDMTAEICVTDALEFLSSIGGLERVGAYNAALSERGRSYLEKELGLTRLAMPASMESPFLKCLALPDFPGCPTDRSECEDLNVDFIEKYHVVVAFVPIEGRPYIRISSQVYNSLEDYQALATALKQLMSAQN